MNEKQYQSLCGWAARTPARQKCLTACFRLLPVLFVFCTALARSVRCLPLCKTGRAVDCRLLGNPRCRLFAGHPDS